MIALTATATAVVQHDIAINWGSSSRRSFIHGFRRSNIAIEVVEISPSQRAGLARELLLDAERRPAIIYTPSRKQAESVAACSRGDFPTAAYHAGLDAERRQRVQEDFLAGKLEVIVATIAFGMGIDKAEHPHRDPHRAARQHRSLLPGDRARRTRWRAQPRHPDALLRGPLHARFLLRARLSGREAAGPDLTARLRARTAAARVHREAEPRPGRTSSRRRSRSSGPTAARSSIRRITSAAGTTDWRDSYIAQGEQKQAQIEAMIRYAQSNQCRMSSLVRHFGDIADSQKPCGICDFCAPENCVAQRFRAATDRGTDLRARRSKRCAEMASSVGKLHTELCAKNGMDRDAFEELMGAMARAGLCA